MKVDLLDTQGLGHAPRSAVCESQGEKFGFDENILRVLPRDTAINIIESGGQLPVNIADKVAKNGCPQFTGGECKLRNNGVCTP